jgi:hypothetical protein
MRHTTISLTIIAACATGIATIAAMASSAGASGAAPVAPAAQHSAIHATGAARTAASAKAAAKAAAAAAAAAAKRHHHHPKPSAIKAQLTGLLNRTGVPPSADRTAEGGYVIQGTRDAQGDPDVGDVSWAELQATPGGPITANNAIDQAITDVRAWNLANPTHLEGLKLRVEAGIHSPSWALNLGGGCFTVIDPTSGTSGCCPRFWTAEFSAAYYQFEAALAAKYDAVPEIREVVMAKNTTVYNESLIRQIQSASTVDALMGAGYTTSVDEQQQISDIASLGTYWKHTEVAFAFNPYQTASPSTQNEAYTQQLITAGRSALGNQLVIENNSLRQAYLTGSGAYQTMYAFMTSTGGPIGFQTATLAKVGSIEAVVNGAKSMGAASVELPTGYATQFTPTQLTTLGRTFSS